MLDPRIYRSGLAVVVLAVLVLAFSLGDQRSALTSPLAPDAFNGQNVASETARLARAYPQRPPGSAADNDLATQVATSLSGFGANGYSVSTDTFSAQTADGERPVENVVAVRPGSQQSGSLVIVAPRDARGSPARAAASGTATLLELGRDLAGESLQRTVVLASTSGTQGMAGVLRLAARVAGPIDAVLVIGDIASRRLQQPIVMPWSSSPQVADPLLRNTVGGLLRSEASLGPTQTSLFGQYLHLAFPLTLSGQAAFGDLGVSAVYVSLTGERGASPGGALAGTDQIDAVGRALLATVSALDAGPEIPSASAYVLLDHKVVPGWAAIAVRARVDRPGGADRDRRAGPRAPARAPALALVGPDAVGLGALPARRGACAAGSCRRPDRDRAAGAGGSGDDPHSEWRLGGADRCRADRAGHDRCVATGGRPLRAAQGPRARPGA